MVSNANKNCEYFLISGFNKTRKPYDFSEIYSQGEEICISPNEYATDFFHYKAPIVDIQIVHTKSRHTLSEDFIVVERTHSKLYKADLNGKTSFDELYLCLRYGRDLSPITDICVVNAKERSLFIKDNWTVIDKTTSGQSASLHSSSLSAQFLAYRRAPDHASVDHLVVTDVCVIIASKGEQCPPAYTAVDSPLKWSPVSNTLLICYKRSVVKEHVLTFQPEVIYCLSSRSTETIVDVDHPDPSQRKTAQFLPEDIADVANFCLPWGATIECWSSKLQSPRPSFITFVLTNINYDRLYGAAMLFYEDFSQDQLTSEEAANLGVREDDGCTDVGVYANKSICILSRRPHFQTFSGVLSFLIEEDLRQRLDPHNDAHSPRLPLERYVAQLLYSVPLPSPDVPTILLQWHSSQPINIHLPIHPVSSKSGSSDDYYHLMRTLTVDQIIHLFLCVLTEQQIVLTSTSPSDLTRIAEALLSMIFPFQWSVVYIPFLYLGRINVIQSPSPYLIGVDSRFFDYFCLPEQVVCLDLITRSIKATNDPHCKYLDHNKAMPKTVLRTLREGLTQCKVRVDTLERAQRPLGSSVDKVDDAHAVAMLRTKDIIAEAVRECFLRAVVIMFKDYQMYLLPMFNKQRNEEMFNAEGFLKSVDKNSRPLYKAIFDTQLWNHFLLERSYVTSSDNSLAFFDRCIKQMRMTVKGEAPMPSLVQTDKVVSSERTKVIPLPDIVPGWCPDNTGTMASGRKSTFPRRLNSVIILDSIDRGEDDPCNAKPFGSLQTHESYSSTSGKYIDKAGKTSSPDPDSALPFIFTSAARYRTVGLNDNAECQVKRTVLSRPQEELRQARQLGKEARQGLEHSWACHVLSSAYCLWFLSLPGLLGYLQENKALRDTGLVDRVLELSIELLHSITKHKLTLPDQVCVRILMLLIHQFQPVKLRLSDVGKGIPLNVFSYGLRNQISLDEEERVSRSPYSNPDSYFASVSAYESVSGDPTTAMDSISTSKVEPSPEDTGDEIVDCEDSQTEINDICAILYNGMVSERSINAEKRNKFFDRTSSTVVSPDSRDSADHTLGTLVTPTHASDNSVTAESLESPIIIQHPSSEKSTDLHASSSLMDDSIVRIQGNLPSGSGAAIGDSGTNIAPQRQDNRHHLESSKTNIADSHHIKIPLTKSRSSFRQFKSAANRSFRSVRRFISSVSTDQVPVQVRSPSGEVGPGMPAAFKPWVHNSGLDTLYHTTSELTSHVTPGDGREPGRSRFGSGGRESPGMDSGSHIGMATIANERGSVLPPVACLTKIWENITAGLSAVKMPIGRYWPNDDTDDSLTSLSIECSSSISVVMTTFSKCNHCHWIIYDDDIMDGWSYDDSELRSVCPHCYRKYSPMVAVKVIVNHRSMNLDQHRSHHDGDDGVGGDGCGGVLGNTSPGTLVSRLAYISQMIYLSPFVLRKEIESVLHQEGEEALLRPDFLERHSILFWNLLLYYSRLSLPSHLFSFLPKWLRDSGRRLTGMGEDMTRCGILTTLTGHEQVSVIFALEMDGLLSAADAPLYRIYIDESLCAGFREEERGSGSAVPGPVPRDLLHSVVASLVKCDIRQAILQMLTLRSLMDRRSASGRDQDSIKWQRSTYRELMHLAVMVLDQHDLNLGTFHGTFLQHWKYITWKQQQLVSLQDKPATNSAFHCRQVFRAPTL